MSISQARTVLLLGLAVRDAGGSEVPRAGQTSTRVGPSRLSRDSLEQPSSSSLSAAVPHSKCQGGKEARTVYPGPFRHFLPWEIPLAALPSALPGSPRAEHPGRFGHTAEPGCRGALGMLHQLPGWCQGGCVAERAPCQIPALSFGSSSPVF